MKTANKHRKSIMRNSVFLATTVTFLTSGAILSACATAATPEPEEQVAPPPVVEVLPPAPKERPVPPLGAVPTLRIPPIDPVTGKRPSPNQNLSEIGTIWNFRSAFNVAALNCVPPTYASVNEYYSTFLTQMKRPLAKANTGLDAEYRARNPGVSANTALRLRDTASTEIYNYYSLPPMMPQFCALMLQKGPQAAALTEDQLYPFAKQALEDIDAIYAKFYDDFEQYQRDLAEWESVQGVRGNMFNSGVLKPATPPAAAPAPVEMAPPPAPYPGQ